jgi:putative SOS response-associated peptidase YedK
MLGSTRDHGTILLDRDRPRRDTHGVCGRYVSVQSDADLIHEFDVEVVVGQPLAPSWNVAPTDPVRVVALRHADGERDAAAVRQLRTVEWGLLPSWSKSASGAAKMINARSETVASKPAFKAAAARRRCLVPASGYFEWKQDGRGKTPYFLHAPDDDPLAMAGLYEIWRDESLPEDDPGRWRWTCTIITRPATDTLGHIHDRCPVLVPAQIQQQWLDCTAGDPALAHQLLERIPEPNLQPRRVSKAVGNVRNNNPALIEPVPEETEQDVLPLSLDDAPTRSGGHT